MKTRSRTASQSVANENSEIQVENKKKSPKKQNNNSLVASIISSIKEENLVKQSAEVESNLPKADVKRPTQKKVAPKVVRGKPKSGRPWKEVKQR